MFSETRKTWKKIKASGENHGAVGWAWMRVRAKACLLCVQVLLLTMCADRLCRFIFQNWQPSDLIRFYAFGWARVIVSILVVATAHANTVSYRRLRKTSSP